jgi:hypothetical protein
MRKARETSEAPVLRSRPKTTPRQSDERLRRLFSQAQRAADARKKAQLKEQFIREFYEGAR